MFQYGDIVKDQTGTVMNKGEGVHFLICGDAHATEGRDPKSGRLQVMEIGDQGFPMGPISFHDIDQLEGMKVVGNLPKIVYRL